MPWGHLEGRLGANYQVETTKAGLECPVQIQIFKARLIVAESAPCLTRKLFPFCGFLKLMLRPQGMNCPANKNTHP